MSRANPNRRIDDASAHIRAAIELLRPPGFAWQREKLDEIADSLDGYLDAVGDVGDLGHNGMMGAHERPGSRYSGALEFMGTPKHTKLGRLLREHDNQER